MPRMRGRRERTVLWALAAVLVVVIVVVVILFLQGLI